MVLQPDGKIVIAGRTWPESGALARLNPDGSLDTSFGAGGYVTDHRIPGFRALALGPDGRIVGASVGGFQLARYLPDGNPDPAFAGGGIGGTFESDQVRFLYGSYGPAAVFAQPDGGIVVAGTHRVNGGGASDGWVKRYDGNGSLAEVIGHVPLPGGPATDSGLSDLMTEPDGSLVGVGWFYAGTPAPSEALLARFLPGTGSDYDHSFGGGQGLVRSTFQAKDLYSTSLTAGTVSGGKLLVAGATEGTMLVARYNLDGTPDGSFAGTGFTAPPISGPKKEASQAYEPASTWASDIAVTAGGAVVLGGGTSQWSKWTTTKNGTFCSECPQPMLAKLRPDGSLDPSFGSGGLLHLAKPDGGTFEGEVEQVTPLADGRLLLKGSLVDTGAGRQPWVARLNPDGSYDGSFGEGGLALPHFPCTDQPAAEQRAAGCVGSAGVRLRLRGVRSGRPSLSLRVRANVAWAPIRELSVTFPRGMRFGKEAKSKLRLAGAGGDARVYLTAGNRKHGPILQLRKLHHASEVRLVLGRGALSLPGSGRLGHRKLAFRIGVGFGDLVAAPEYGGNQTIVRRAG